MAALAASQFVVKHTFLELAEEQPLSRARAATDFVGCSAAWLLDSDAASTAASCGDDSESNAGGKSEVTTQVGSIAWSDLDPEDDDCSSLLASERSPSLSSSPAPRLPAQPKIASLMLHHLPREFSRDQLLHLLYQYGALVQARFVYLPMDTASGLSLGYAFVTLASAEAAQQLWNALEGLEIFEAQVGKAMKVSPSTLCQTVEEQVEKFRNSPLMHASVADEMKPILLQDGVRVPFPAPTKKIRAPRRRDQERLRTENRKGRASEASAECSESC